MARTVSLPYSMWQLSSVSPAPAVAFGKHVGGGQECKVQFDLMAFHEAVEKNRRYTAAIRSFQPSLQRPTPCRKPLVVGKFF